MKKNVIAAFLCSACLSLGLAGTAFADGQVVVTLGNDLTNEQKTMMINYFGAKTDQVNLIYVTNQEERDFLSSSIPVEQIGTRTISCAMVSPTKSGGIRVKTANLDYVTCNMIASALSTSGVVNCDVIAAAPFKVSGTGALTGILKAYETATGTTLDTTKKDLAVKEMTVTSDVAESVGRPQATSIINDVKLQVVQNNITNYDATEITNIINNVAVQNNVTINQTDMTLIQQLIDEYIQQNYSYDDVKDTLNTVIENTNPNYVPETEAETIAETDAEVFTEEATESETSILDGTDTDALTQTGSGPVIITDTSETEAITEASTASGESESDGWTVFEPETSAPIEGETDIPLETAPAEMETFAPIEGETDIPSETTPAETVGETTESETWFTVQTETPETEIPAETAESETWFTAQTENPATEMPAETAESETWFSEEAETSAPAEGTTEPAEESTTEASFYTYDYDGMWKNDSDSSIEIDLSYNESYLYKVVDGFIDSSSSYTLTSESTPNTYTVTVDDVAYTITVTSDTTLTITSDGGSYNGTYTYTASN